MKNDVLRRLTVLSVIAVIALVSGNLISAQTRSYMNTQVMSDGPYGPIIEVPQNTATWVTWNADRKSCAMGDGTMWNYSNDNNGYHFYTYVGSSIGVIPYTQYSHAVFNYDYSTMAIFYSFGMQGMMINMRSDWQYIGEGKQAAEDWATGNY